MFAASTFEGGALTWWNRNVHTLGLVTANRIPWNEFKSMMTIEYCPATEIQRMEEELWTLTLKGDDIRAYNNRFYELALMFPELVPTEKKKVERYIKWFPKRIKGNITSSKPTTLHEAINMARELVEQAVQGKAAREKDCWVRFLDARGKALQNVTCFGCGEKGHYKNSILFDSGVEKSFVSTEFTPFINIAPATLDTSYEVELVDGKIVNTNTVLRGFTLAFYNHCFKIDLLPTRLESFDVIVGMDWLSYQRGVIVCYEKIVHIPLTNGFIGEESLEDIRIVHDFPEVFPDDLSGLPLVREIEFCIDLISSALPVVKSPYRLAPSEMIELSNQLKELQEKGFIRPSHSP
ncbi:putative reverse transcriptase domain-containing protein [Tanacetum coccineum]